MLRPLFSVGWPKRRTRPGLYPARNFGHQLAITCGMDHARGDAIITMDGDLQHPPEMIPELIQKWRDGSDVVQTIREATDDAGL